MTFMHRELAAGRWNEMSLVEQLGHVGSEVDRALHWREKGNEEYCLRACDRALELLDLTIACPANRYRLKEVTRAREVLVDFFYCDNDYHSTGPSLSRYFLQFAYLARNRR